MDEFVDTFKTKKCIFVPDIIDKNMCNVFREGSLFSMANIPSNQGGDHQVDIAHCCEYANPFTESLLLHCMPCIEKVTGLELAPLNSYLRIYKAGSELPIHKDRSECEISVSITIGYDIDDPWPIFVIYEDGTQHDFVIPIGSGLVLRGSELKHGRKPLQGHENTYQVQAFLHYIDKNGPFFPEFLNDKRKVFGIK